MVFATAVRLLGNAADAEDAAQTVFLKAFQRFDEIGSSPAAAGWLKTAATNVCLNHLSRYRARWRFFSEMGDGEAGAPAYADSLASDERWRSSSAPTRARRSKPPSGRCRITSGCRWCCFISKGRAIRPSPTRWACRWPR